MKNDLRIWKPVRPIMIASLLAVALLCSAPAGAQSLSAAPSTEKTGVSGYHLLKTFPIPGDTFWDYLKYEPSTHRLFITHGDHVVVIDAPSGKIVGNVGGMEAIHGVVLAPEFNRGFVTDGRGAKVWIFDLKTLKVIGSATADPDADGEVYDPASKRVFTMNGDSKSSTVIDAKTGEVVGHIDLGGSPEFPVADGEGHVYANLESTSEIVEIESHTMKITHRWPLAPGEHPSGLAIDTQHHILFSGCHNKMMIMMDATNGKVLGNQPIGEGVDAMRFDPETQDGFASTGDGNLTIIHEDSPTSFHVVENVPTARGARTMALDPTTGNVFTVTATVERIPNPPPHTRPFRMVPGTFHLLIFGK